MPFLAHVTTQLVAAADTVGTTYTITCTDSESGLTFHPTAIIGFVVGRDSAGVGEASAMFGWGAAVSASNRRSGSHNSSHNVSPTVEGGNNDNNTFISEVNDSGVTGRLDVDALLDDGYRLIVDDQFAADRLVLLVAIGGDVTHSFLGTLGAPAAAGDVDVNVGFPMNTGKDDKLVLFFGPGDDSDTLNANTFSRGGAMFFMGAAAGESISQWRMRLYWGDGVSTTNTQVMVHSGDCIALGGTNSIQTRASVTAWLPTGFRLNYATTQQFAMSFVLALKGAPFQVGTTTSRTDTTPTLVSTSRRPKLLLLASIGAADTGETGAASPAQVSVSAAVGASSRVCLAHLSATGVNPSDNATGIFTDRIYHKFDAAAADKSTALAAADLSSFSSSGWTFVMTDPEAGGGTSLMGYIVGGDGDARGKYGAITLSGRAILQT